MYLRFVFLVLMATLPFGAEGQYFFQEDPVELDEVQVVSSRLDDYAVGATVEQPDTVLVKMHKDASLSSLLADVSGVSLKTYGSGGLSSVSLRGGMSDHTAVMWNGINIQSPMNGGVNFSSMPVSFFNNVEVQHGGSGTLFGSGAMSGVIHLSSDNLFTQKNGMDASLSAGSFGLRTARGGFKTGGNKFASRVSAFGQKADNDFTYTNTSRISNPEEEQTNAGLEQFGLLQENHWRISEKSLIKTGVWYQSYDKDIQTLMTSRNPNNTSQKDNNLVASASFKHYGNSGTFLLKQGLVRNKVVYSDPDMVDPDADNNVFSWINEADYKYRIGQHHSVNAGINYTYEKAFSDGYDGSAIRNRVAFFASGRYGFDGGRGSTVLSIRNEMSDEGSQPVVFSLGANYNLFNQFRIKGNFSRNYRLPDLNDLHWREDGYAMGNPDLKPESGWSGDFGVNWKVISVGRLAANLEATAFASQTDDLIVWLPENGGKWMPNNKREGKAYGMETGLKFSSEWNQYALKGRFFYTYTRSVLSTDDEYDDQQMIYTPEHKLTANSSFAHGPVYVSGAVRYVGERYYDHSGILDPYVTGDVSLGYSRRMLGVETDWSLNINNLWNTDYQVVAWYAMPPRNYKFTLSITI
ncbi:MAG: TonB-dependent receptor plug domain-containing protein [Marinilabiliaceae bacterium]